MTTTNKQAPDKNTRNRVREQRERIRMWAAVLGSLATTAQVVADLWKK